MLCQRCGKKEAVIPLCTVHNGVKKVEYLCQDCGGSLFGSSNLSFNINNPWQMMANLMDNMLGMEAESHYPDVVCPVCGTTFMEFTKRGRFGCSECYEVFKDRLVPIFDDIHFSHEYKGRMPQSPGLLKDEERLKVLDREKREAAAREDYQRAAELQVEIRELKKKMGGEKK